MKEKHREVTFGKDRPLISMIRPLRTETGAMDKSGGFFRMGHFRTRNSTSFFEYDEEAVVDEVVVVDDDDVNYSTDFSYKKNTYEYEFGCPECRDTRSGSPTYKHTDGLVSCNNVHRNVLYQVSPAQIERMKTYRAVRLPWESSQGRSYELVKRLEAIAASHNTSVPIVLRAWTRERRRNEYMAAYEDDEDEDEDEEEDEEDEDISIRLSTDEVSSLNRTLAEEW